MIENITTNKAVISLVDEPIPVGFANLYEEGDLWKKIKGCESCPVEQRKQCCGNCPCVLPDGQCYWHVVEPKGSRKWYNCVIAPTPDKFNSNCCIEYECIQGNNVGKIRRVKDQLNVLVDK